jgi:hypothetical protein
MQSNRRRFTLAALASLPASLIGQTRNPETLDIEPDVITQVELRKIRDSQRRTDALCIGIRERFDAGALIEPGPISIRSTEPVDPCVSSGLGNEGLNLSW